MKAWSLVIIFMACFSILLVGCSDNDVGYSIEPTVPQIVIEPASVGVGEEVDVPVRIVNVENIVGYQFDVFYEPGVLEFVSVDEGGFLDENGASKTFWVNPNSSEPGLVKNLAVVRLTARVGVSGEGVLLTLKFKGKARGTSELLLNNLKVVDVDTQSIEIAYAPPTITVK